MVGSLVLKECLNRDGIGRITSIGRRKSGLTHPKLLEVIHENFLDLPPVVELFKRTQSDILTDEDVVSSSTFQAEF